MILEIIYLLLPAYVSNMSPVIVRGFIPYLNSPVDMGKKFRGKPLFGRHKTWRGLLSGIIFGTAACYIQYLLSSNPYFASISVVDYSQWLTIGFLLSFGALAGDMAESFFKRQLSIAEGKPWLPFDQIDFTLGALLLLSFYYVPSATVVLYAVAISFIVHILFTHLAFYIGLRKERW